MSQANTLETADALKANTQLLLHDTMYPAAVLIQCCWMLVSRCIASGRHCCVTEVVYHPQEIIQRHVALLCSTHQLLAQQQCPLMTWIQFCSHTYITALHKRTSMQMLFLKPSKMHFTGICKSATTATCHWIQSSIEEAQSLSWPQ